MNQTITNNNSNAGTQIPVQSSTLNPTGDIQSPPVTIRKVRNAFGWEEVLKRTYEGVISKTDGKTIIDCPYCPAPAEGFAPLHQSLYLFDDKRFHCTTCGKHGTSLEYTLKVKPEFGGVSMTATLFLTKGLYEEGPPVVLQMEQPAPRDRAQRAEDAVIRLYVHPQYQALKEYAGRRGWFVKNMITANGYPLGAEEISLAKFQTAEKSAPGFYFPKLIQTRRMAECFRLEKEFAAGRELYLEGLHRPQAGVHKNVPIWIKEAGYNPELPWELDAHEDAPILIVCGHIADALKLFNEAHANPEKSEYSGSRWHIIAVDNFGWGVDSVVRRPIQFGKEEMVVSPWDGFEKIVFISDQEKTRYAERMGCLAKAMNMKSQVSVVTLPVQQLKRPGTETLNPSSTLESFFRAGSSIKDLKALVKAAPEIK